MGVLALGDNLTVVEKNLSTTSLSLTSVILPLASCSTPILKIKNLRWDCISKQIQIGIQTFSLHT